MDAAADEMDQLSRNSLPLLPMLDLSMYGSQIVVDNTHYSSLSVFLPSLLLPRVLPTAGPAVGSGFIPGAPVQGQNLDAEP